VKRSQESVSDSRGRGFGGVLFCRALLSNIASERGVAGRVPRLKCKEKKTRGGRYAAMTQGGRTCCEGIQKEIYYKKEKIREKGSAWFLLWFDAAKTRLRISIVRGEKRFSSFMGEERISDYDSNDRTVIREVRFRSTAPFLGR